MSETELNLDSTALTESERKYITKFGISSQISIDQRVEGTCTWSLQSQQYQHWRQLHNSSVLWVTGEAGSGKTIITAFLFEILEQTKVTSRNPLQGDIVCSFFCTRDVQTQKDARSILRGLLGQILLSRKDIIHRIKASFDSGMQDFDQSFETLWKIFRLTLQIVPCKCLYIVVDAVDECEQGSKEQILSKFAQILEDWRKLDLTKVKKLKFIMSGQPHILTAWNAIAAPCENDVLRIEDRPDGLVRDVIHFINYKVDQLVANLVCTAASGEKLKKALYSRAENSFLWVSVVLNYIKTSLAYRDANILRMLTDFPGSLKEAYAKYLPTVA